MVHFHNLLVIENFPERLTNLTTLVIVTTYFNFNWKLSEISLKLDRVVWVTTKQAEITFLFLMLGAHVGVPLLEVPT